MPTLKCSGCDAVADALKSRCARIADRSTPGFPSLAIRMRLGTMPGERVTPCRERTRTPY